MCGIFATNHPDLDVSKLKVVDRRLSFRGPDFRSGIIEHQGWKLYHSRLSIIAPTNEFSQPFHARDGSVTVFNGEILNFRDLLLKYSLPDFHSDTQALSELLCIPDFDLNLIEGFFAFVRVDVDGHLTHCARDKFGVKPLNYCEIDGHLTISSEASVLSDLFDLSYDDAAMSEYRAFRAPLFSGSYFEGVNCVQPGSCMLAGRYFQLRNVFESAQRQESCTIAKLTDTLKDSIQSRLLSDVPVGLLYSGGIDSNLINTFTDQKLHKLTGGLSEDYDIKFALERSDKLGDNNSTVVQVSPQDFKQRFYEMVELRKEPLSVPNEVVLSFLAEKWAHMGGKVLLSGEAADEFFAGYDRIFAWAGETKEFDLNKFIELYCYCERSDVCQQVILSLTAYFDNLEELSVFEKVRYFFIDKHLPVLFRRLDFALMFAGVEGREPLATTSVLTLALSHTSSELVQNNLGKHPLRKISAKEFGNDFAYAKKVGFPVDINLIFFGDKSLDRHQNYFAWYTVNKDSLDLL